MLVGRVCAASRARVPAAIRRRRGKVAAADEHRERKSWSPPPTALQRFSRRAQQTRVGNPWCPTVYLSTPRPIAQQMDRFAEQLHTAIAELADVLAADHPTGQASS